MKIAALIEELPGSCCPAYRTLGKSLDYYFLFIIDAVPCDLLDSISCALTSPNEESYGRVTANRHQECVCFFLFLPVDVIGYCVRSFLCFPTVLDVTEE